MKIPSLHPSFWPALFLALTLFIPAPNGRSADWPQWRGPGRHDHSPDTGLLQAWPAGGPKLKWIYDNAGLGYAGYSVVAGHLFTMGLREDQEYLIAVDTTNGHPLWATPAGSRYPNHWGDGPRMTPTVDGDRV